MSRHDEQTGTAPAGALRARPEPAPLGAPAVGPETRLAAPAALPGTAPAEAPGLRRSPEAGSAEAEAGLWRSTLSWIVAALVTAALAWLTYSGQGWIPILSGADLGVHEFGHLLTFWAPPLLCSLAGSLLQVAAPLGLAAYFFWRRRDAFAAILCVAWAAENLNNVSVYIADAQRMVLPLFGDDGSGAGHDWHNILGALGWLGATDEIANLVRTGSVMLFVVALGLAVTGFSRSRRRR